MRRSCSSATSMSCWRRSGASDTPEGFWKFVIVYTHLTLRPSDLRALDLLAKVGYVYAAVVLTNADHLCLRVVERDDTADVAGQLDQRDVSGIEYHSRGEVEALLRACGHHDLCRARSLYASRSHDVDHGFDQLALAARRAVLKRKHSALAYHARGDLGHLFYGKRLGAGRARGERDYVAAAQHLCELANGVGPHGAAHFREQVFVFDLGFEHKGAARLSLT